MGMHLLCRECKNLKAALLWRKLLQIMMSEQNRTGLVSQPCTLCFSSSVLSWVLRALVFSDLQPIDKLHSDSLDELGRNDMSTV